MDGEIYFAAGCVLTMISVLLFTVGKAVLFLRKRKLIQDRKSVV